MTELTIYAARDLRRMAVQAVKEDAKAAGLRAKFIGWSLEVRNSSTTLLSWGHVQQAAGELGTRAFSVRTAL